MNRRKASFSGMVTVLQSLTDEEQLALIDNPYEFKELVRALAIRSAKNIFFAPVADNNVPKKFQEITIKWRKFAAELGYTGPVAWKVRTGFTFKKHAPKAGPCNSNFDVLKHIRLKNDEPTKKSFVFWIPRLVNNSKNKSHEDQLVIMTETRKKFFLPDHHLSSFGSAAFLSGLILAHFKRTGERVPLNKEWTRTDIFDSSVLSERWNLGDFDEKGLYTENWDINSPRIGFFPLGIEYIN